MVRFHLADLSKDQMSQLERFEHDLGLTLIAYAPGESKGAGKQEGEDSVMDALVDDYRTYDSEDL